MAGDWLQLDCDLPEKPETQKICDITGAPLDLVVGRLFLFWRWVDRHTTGPEVVGSSLKTLARLAGGDEPFWQAVAQVGWLRVTRKGLAIPGWDKRFSKSAKARIRHARNQANYRAGLNGDCDESPGDHATITTSSPKGKERKGEESSFKEDIRSNSKTLPPKDGAPFSFDHEKAGSIAGEVFRLTGFKGRDRLPWQAGMLVCLGIKSEFWAIDSASASAGKKNPMAYFRGCLAEKCSQDGDDLDELLKSVPIPKEFHCGPPQSVGTIAPPHIKGPHDA